MSRSLAAFTVMVAAAGVCKSFLPRPPDRASCRREKFKGQQ